MTKVPFRVRIGENTIDVRPDPEAPGKSLLIINGKVHRGDFRIAEGARRPRLRHRTEREGRVINVGTTLTKRGELKDIRTLEALVGFYVANRERLWAGCERSVDRHDPIVDYAREKARDLREAIKIATAGRRRNGKMFSEDSCIKKSARAVFTTRLLARTGKIARAADFDALYDLVRAEKITRIGDLMVYNVAARIGAYLGLDPVLHLYVHAGPRKGWRALVGRGDNRYRIPIQEVPKELRVLKPCLIEDFLCEFSSFVHPGLWR